MQHPRAARWLAAVVVNMETGVIETATVIVEWREGDDGAHVLTKFIFF
jgi:hypothetical protein